MGRPGGVEGCWGKGGGRWGEGGGGEEGLGGGVGGALFVFLSSGVWVWKQGDPLHRWSHDAVLSA